MPKYERHRCKRAENLKTSYSVGDVRDALQMNDLDAEELRDLEGMLPGAWRELIGQCGREKVFECLRRGLSITTAKFELLKRAM